jgi:hypothetical protein
LAASEYNHLAGRLGVVLMAALLQDGVLDGEHRPGVGADRLAGPGRMTGIEPAYSAWEHYPSAWWRP